MQSSLSNQVSSTLQGRTASAQSVYVFPGEVGKAFLGTSLNHQHQKIRASLALHRDFVMHSLRHTMLTRLGDAGADAFTIMRIAGHSSVAVSQRYVHPSPESLERAFERLEIQNGKMDGMTANVQIRRGPITFPLQHRTCYS